MLATTESEPVSRRRWGCFASIQLAEERGFRAWVLRESVRLRTRWRHMPYGDQALFVRRDLFWCASGLVWSRSINFCQRDT